MDKYLNSFREMISLRGLTDHTLKSYCTYILAYLDYLSCILRVFALVRPADWLSPSQTDTSKPFCTFNVMR